MMDSEALAVKYKTCSSLWELTPDGPPIRTPSSHLWPVRHQDHPAMLKIATSPEEAFGAELMTWWEGQGAARVLARKGTVTLMERATGTRSLGHMALNGEDDAATQIICDVVAKLHGHRNKLPLELMPLTQWFASLFAAAAREGGLFARCAQAGQALLDSQREVVTLHGDIHHGNILDFGPTRGWLAIDPKRLGGERGFDYANLFCNPDRDFAATPGLLAHRLDLVAKAARLERQRLGQWVLAWTGLSAAWFAEDGATANVDATLRLAEIAAAELDKF